MFYSALLVVGVGLLVLMALRVGLDEFYLRLADVPVEWVLLSIFVYFLILLLGLFRWYVYFRVLGVDVSIRDLRNAYFLNCFVSNLTPGRSGDVLVPKYLSDSAGVSMRSSSAMLITERVGDLLVLLISVAISVVLLANYYDVVVSLDFDFGVILPIFFMLLCLVFFGGRLVLSRSQYDLSGAFSEVRFGLSKFIKLRQLVLVALFSSLNWMLHICKEYLFLSAFISIAVGQAFVCQSVSAFLALISLVPGGIGVNVASVAVLAKSIGLDWEGAAVSTTVSTLLFSLIRFSLGMWFFRFHPGKNMNRVNS